MNYIPQKSDFESDLIIKQPVNKAGDVMPEVTVITVCYNPLKDNRQDSLAHNLNSVQSQRDISLEHLIIDGFSNDGTIQYLTQYHNPNYEIRILSKPDSGIYEAMNRGISLARGQYVIFLNTDDFYHNPYGLSASLSAIKQTNCAFTFSPIKVIGPHSKHSPHLNPHRKLHKYFLFCTIAHPSMLYSRQVLLSIGGYDQQYQLSADYDLNLRIISEGNQGCYVSTNFVTFLMGGASTQHRAQGISEKIKIIQYFHNKQYQVNLTNAEAVWMVKHEYYPAKYRWMYKKAQDQISKTFINIPNNLMDMIIRKFNYIKYDILSYTSKTIYPLSI